MLVTVADFETRLGQTLDGADLARAQAALDDVSTEVLDVGDDTWTDQTVPDVVTVVIFRAARRAFDNPDGVRSERQDTYQYELERADGSYLTADEVRKVRKAAGLANGIRSIELVHHYGFEGTEPELSL